MSSVDATVESTIVTANYPTCDVSNESAIYHTIGLAYYPAVDTAIVISIVVAIRTTVVDALYTTIGISHGPAIVMSKYLSIVTAVESACVNTIWTTVIYAVDSAYWTTVETA